MSADERAIPSCQEVFERLADWAEGRLAAAEEEPVERHLRLCPPCGSFARTYRALAAVARSALAVEMPAEARARLRRVLLARFRGVGQD
jgi:anti-sigma factor ChrR (cupin superfamily)